MRARAEEGEKSATGSEIRAGQLPTRNAKLSWPGIGRQLGTHVVGASREFCGICSCAGWIGSLVGLKL